MILRNGDHTLRQAHHAIERLLVYVMRSLLDQRVLPEGCLIKTSFVTQGSENDEVLSPEDIARASHVTYGRIIVPSIPGIIFLSKGLDYETATRYLNACVKAK